MNQRQVLHGCAAGSLITLTVLCLGWELWWAPLRPGGSLLVIKAVPLLLPLFGILRGKRHTFQWSSMFILLYLMEGLVRATSEHGAGRWLAAMETVLSLAFLISAVGYARTASGDSPPGGSVRAAD